MSTTENLRVGGEGRFYDAEAKLGRSLASAHAMLESDFIEACYTSPRMTLATPGSRVKRQELLVVIRESLDDEPETFVHLLEILRDAASGKPDTAAAGARAWIAQRAKVFAQWHASDMVDE